MYSRSSCSAESIGCYDHRIEEEEGAEDAKKDQFIILSSRSHCLQTSLAWPVRLEE